MIPSYYLKPSKTIPGNSTDFGFTPSIWITFRMKKTTYQNGETDFTTVLRSSVFPFSFEIKYLFLFLVHTRYIFFYENRTAATHICTFHLFLLFQVLHDLSAVQYVGFIQSCSTLQCSWTVSFFRLFVSIERWMSLQIAGSIESSNGTDLDLFISCLRLGCGIQYWHNQRRLWAKKLHCQPNIPTI